MFLALTLLSCDRGVVESPLMTFEEPPSNVLMISLDTFRRDQLGRYGGEERTFLDGLLSEALVLDDHRSCSSWTYPSAVCAMSGADQRAIDFMPQRREGTRLPNLPAGVSTIAQALQRSGRSTALVSGNTFIGSVTGLERGYDAVVVEELMDGVDVVDRGLGLLEDMADNKDGWFLHLHFMDPHMPYDAPAEYLGDVPETEFELIRHVNFEELNNQWYTLDDAAKARARADAVARYSAEINYMDDQLQRLWDALDAQGALDDTLVVVWSDHGEQFWEHDRVAHGNGVHYEENAAMAAFWSKELGAQSWDGMTAHQDLMPTLLGALGIASPEGLEGRAAGVGRECRYADSFDQVLDRNMQSVEDGGWRLVYTWTGELELYDISADPAEVSDLYTPDHPEAQRLWELLEPRVERADALTPDPVPITPAR